MIEFIVNLFKKPEMGYLFLEIAITVIGSFVVYYLRNWFLKLIFEIKLALLVIMMISSASCLILYYTQVNTITDLYEQSLSTPTVPNDLPHKTFEAIILNSYQNENDFSDKIVNPQAANQLGHFVKDSEKLKASDTQSWQSIEVAENNTIQFNEDSGIQSNVFVPSFAIPSNSFGKNVSEVMEGREDLTMELNACLLYDRIVDNILNTEIIDSFKVVQSFLIGELGTTLLKNKNNDGFKPRPLKHFAARPYFQSAINRRKKMKNNKINVFDHVTEPYFDYGGYGAVRTFCIAVQLPNGRFVVLGFDCLLPQTALKDKIQAIDSQGKLRTAQIQLDSIGKGNTALKIAGATSHLSETDKGILNDYIFNFENPKSNFFGSVHHFKDPSSNKGYFTIPSQKINTPNNLGQFYIAMVDFDRQNYLDFWFFLGLFWFGLFFGGLGSVIYQYRNHNLEMSRLREALSSMMHRSNSLPFFWCNEHNEIIDCNSAFLRLLRYKDKNDLLYVDASHTIKRQFISIVRETEKYQHMLDKNNEKPSAGENTWSLRRNTPFYVRCRTYGVGFYNRSFNKRDHIQHFGVILSSKVVKREVELDQAEKIEK